MRWLLVVSAVTAIPFDIIEGILHREFNGTELWLSPAKYALYAAVGVFLIRRRTT
jgi:hypothetical protein